MAEQQARGTGAGTVRAPARTTVGTTTTATTTKTGTARTARTATAAAAAGGGAGQGSGTDRRCGWCRRVLPQAGSVGRPRLYCGQACRQRAYEQRSATAKAGLSDDVVLVRRAELDGLQDRLFQLRCALEDVQTLLGERHTKAELERSLADLLHSTGRLDRLWVTERAG